MRFILDGLPVYFPYTYIYPEQYRYMLSLKRSLDAKGPCVLEMPSGTGKTVSLLSLILSYQLAHPEVGKLVYCSRTVSEIEKCVEEAKRVIAYLQEELGEHCPRMLCLALSARRNLCIHPEISKKRNGAEVDAACRDKTASWVRENIKSGVRMAESTDSTGDTGGNGEDQGGGESSSGATANGSIGDIEDLGLCSFYEGFERDGKDALLEGVYSLQDMKEVGRKRGWCPYFLARHLLLHANIVVYSYHYILDPKIASLVSGEIGDNSIVVFDEAHNIDNVCIESLSVNLSRSTLEACARNVIVLNNAIRAAKRSGEQRLREEYKRLIEGLAREGLVSVADEILGDPVLTDDLVREVVPGNIRKGEHFVALLRRLTEFTRHRLMEGQLISESPRQFLHLLQSRYQVDPASLKFCAARLSSLLRTLEMRELQNFVPLTQLCALATLLGTYAAGPVRRFTILIEEVYSVRTAAREMVLQLCCLDASLAIAPVIKRFRSIVITSGTLSPLEMFPRLLDFRPVISDRFSMSLHRPCVCPLIVTRGSDQVAVSSKFDLRNDKAVVRNYGSMLVELCGTVPDGIVCFFTSYHYMEGILDMWNTMGFLSAILKHKLLFVETTDTLETSVALENYRKACDCGRGAVFFSVARGKVSEGIDFDHHYGRCVILFGIPYVYTESRVLRARLDFLRDQYGIREGDFLTFDAMRAAAQCVGRVIRGKTDYGMMVFADKRYNRMDKRSKLPQWIGQFIGDSHCNLSTEMACAIGANFFKNMAQPTSHKDELGESLWTLEHVLQQETSAPAPKKPEEADGERDLMDVEGE